MLRTTTLLALGSLAVGATPLLARPPQLPTPTVRQITAPLSLAQLAPDTVSTEPVITLWEPSPTDRSVNDISHVQFWLKELKLYDGPTSGVMNSDTHDALRKFERAHNLPVTGRISDDVVTLLRQAAGPPPDCSW